MSDFFKYFPTIKYGNTVAKDITKRVRVLDNIRDDPYAFLPYTIRDGETPEEVAFYYYGEPTYSWLIFLANDIIDPYTQWPMSNENFEKTLARNYEADARVALNKRTGHISDREIVEWTQLTSRTDNIICYRYIGNDPDSTIQYDISRDTYLYNNDIVQGDYTPVRIYEHEFEINESYRNINLLNVNYLEIAVRNLESAVNV
jgi:hypothetical protein